MCIEVMVVKNGVEVLCDTVGQLAQVLGVPPNSVSDDPQDCCLCNAHLVELGARQTTDAEGWPNPERIIIITD